LEEIIFITLKHISKCWGLMGWDTVWTETELKLLRNLYSKSSKAEVINALPNRTWLAIRTKAWKLGIKFRTTWSKKDIDYLIKHYKTTSVKKISESLGRPIPSIYDKARKLGLFKRHIQHDVYPPLSRLSDLERGRLIGLIDGEGTITIHPPKRRSTYVTSARPAMYISNKNKDLMLKLKQIMPFGHIVEQPDSIFIFTILSAKRILEVLDQVGDELIVKKRHAELMRKFLESRLSRGAKRSLHVPFTEEELGIIEEMGELNKHGKSRKVGGR
jgi:hypothetical protein